MHLWRMLRGGQPCERDLLALQLARPLFAGIRPHDWPHDLVLRALALAKSRAEVHASAATAYAWALDRGDIARASAYLDQLLATCPKPAQPPAVLALEAAYFEARYRGHPDLARAWLLAGSGGEFGSVMRLRAEAALYLVEGRYGEALMRAADGLAAWEERAPRTISGLRTEEEDLRKMAAEARQFQTARAGVRS